MSAAHRVSVSSREEVKTLADLARARQEVARLTRLALLLEPMLREEFGHDGGSRPAVRA